MLWTVTICKTIREFYETCGGFSFLFETPDATQFLLQTENEDFFDGYDIWILAIITFEASVKKVRNPSWYKLGYWLNKDFRLPGNKKNISNNNFYDMISLSV